MDARAGEESPRAGQRRRFARDAPVYVGEALRERVGLACSGGIDSTALVLLAAKACCPGDITLPVVIHVDHRVREGSEDEVAMVARLADAVGLPFVATAVNWESSSGGRREHELRDGRYAALARVAQRLGLNAIVTAHTFDDQIETILMRLLSGTGGTSGAGMSSVSVLATTAGQLEVRRPLLGVPRSDLLPVIERSGIPIFHDPSNDDRRHRRNALRLDVIPQLRAIFPGFEGALVRSAMLSRQDSSALDEIAKELAGDLLTRSSDGVELRRRGVQSAHPAIASRLIRLAVVAMMGTAHRDLSRERIDSVVRAASGRTGAVIELPGGIEARVGRTDLVFRYGSTTVDDVGRGERSALDDPSGWP